MTDVVRLSGVTRRFVLPGEVVTALDTVDLRVEQGELLGLAGPSGSGKTTLVHVVLGWERPDAGTVVLDVAGETGFRGVAVVPQDLGLLPSLTVRQNVQVAARLARLADAGSRVEELLADLEIGQLADRLPDEVSLGEQQRVAVARALVCRPGLLVADEPTAHQDERRAVLIVDALRARAEQGGAVIVTSHDPRVLDGATRVCTLEDGMLHEPPPRGSPEPGPAGA